MAKENLTESQKAVLDRMHSSFMEQNVNPLIDSNRFSEEEAVNFISLFK